MLGMKSKGEANFNGCPHKTVESNPLPVASGNLLDMGNFYGYMAANLNPNMTYPRETTVSCPMAERSIAENGTLESTRQSLAKTMGKEICKNCPLVNGSKKG